MIRTRRNMRFWKLGTRASQERSWLFHLSRARACCNRICRLESQLADQMKLRSSRRGDVVDNAVTDQRAQDRCCHVP